MRARLFVTTISVLAVALAGCSTAASSPAVEHNEADVKFSQEMIPHHQQTIQMADLASKRATGEPVKVVAASILSAEQAEINLMTGWLATFKAPPPGAGHAGHTMPGMLSTTDFEGLATAPRGAEFDKQWLTLIAKHLGSGVQMSKSVLSAGKHPETRTLAEKIVAAQEKEIAEVTDLLGK